MRLKRLMTGGERELLELVGGHHRLLMIVIVIDQQVAPTPSAVASGYVVLF